MANNRTAQTDEIVLEVERTFWDRLADAIQLLSRDWSGIIGFILFWVVVVAAIFSPQLSPYDPLEQDLRNNKIPPAWSAEGSWDHPLGTDSLGRDMLSRIIYGTRVSLTIGFFGVLMAGGIGLAMGTIAGYFGGRVDAVIMGAVNLVLSLPYLLFVVFVAAILGRSLLNVILIFGITDAPIFARVARGEVLRIRESGYVESAISVGARWSRIIFDHILPNLIGSLITLATFEMSAMIFYEASLGFLGLSVPPTVPSWGNMLSSGRMYLTSAPWIVTFPGLAIMVTSLGMNLLGDWMRDVLDPRLRRERK